MNRGRCRGMRDDRTRQIPRLREIYVQRRNHLGPFTDSGGNTLDGARAHVANCEHTGTVRFEWQTALAGQRFGADESTRIDVDAGSRKPLRIRLRADE